MAPVVGDDSDVTAWRRLLELAHAVDVRRRLVEEAGRRVLVAVAVTTRHVQPLVLAELRNDVIDDEAVIACDNIRNWR